MTHTIARMAEDRWEHGSDFHWLNYTDADPDPFPWPLQMRGFGCGRDAFRAIIQHGVATRGWRRLWIPSYFCQEVVEAFLLTNIQVMVYPYGPDDAAPDFRRVDWRHGDVLLDMGFFGLSVRSKAQGVDRSRVEIIENHTHDPWSRWARQSDADWCVASLRKILPIPDGAVLWSPAGHDLPAQPPTTRERATVAARKLAAMLLKGFYLQGEPLEKDTFRMLAVAGEREMPSGDVSGMSEWAAAMYTRFPALKWRELRRENHRVFSESLADIDWLEVLQPEDASCCPFSAVVVFDSPERRDLVKQELIGSRIYPAVLWSLDEPLVPGIPPRHIDLSRRMLSIHCDVRYKGEDMERVARLVRAAGSELSQEISELEVR